MIDDPSIRILYIDQDMSAATFVKKQLANATYHIDYACQEDEYIDHLSHHEYSLLILRLAHKMPISVIDTLVHYMRIPSILVLGHQGQASLIADALKRGAGDYLFIDDHETAAQLMPIVVKNILRRYRLEKEKRDMLAALQQRNRALSYLNQIGNELTSILELKQLMTRLMRSGIDVLDTEGSSLWLWEDEREERLVCEAVIHRISTPPLVGFSLSKEIGLVGWVATNNRSAITNSTTSDKRHAKHVDGEINFKTDSLLAVPLRSKDKVVGVLEFVNKLESEFEDEDLKLAETLAAYTATAIENARLVESLQASTQELQAQNAELDAFGYTVAHDIQNMIARVLGFGQHLLDEANDVDTSISKDVVMHPISVIVRDSQKMSKVIDALMLLSAVRQVDVPYETVDINHTVTESLYRLSEPIQEKGAQLTIPNEWPPVIGYTPWIEEVWFNYIGNALKYGGDPPFITLGYSLIENEYAEFWIKDEGPGIAQEDQFHLFRPFTDYANRKSAGHGLGLSIVERIMTRLNGDVGVKSNLGEGCYFYFTLPLAKKR